MADRKYKKEKRKSLTRGMAAQIIYEAAKRVRENRPASLSEPATVQAALKELKLDLELAAGNGVALIMRSSSPRAGPRAGLKPNVSSSRSCS